MTVDLRKPPGHARWCSGGCPRWLGIDAPTCLPMPCQCEATKTANPEWGRRERCWWRSKRDHRIHCRCPCWGSPRDGRPGDCCAHHSANPRYIGAIPETLDEAAEVQPHDVERDDPHETNPEAEDLDGLFSDWDDNPYAVVRQPYVARWTRAELHCPCITPFDQSKTSTGWHCPGEGCHQNFKSWQVGSMHRRLWTEPCRPPAGLVDVDTGQHLMRQDAQGVWGVAYG